MVRRHPILTILIGVVVLLIAASRLGLDDLILDGDDSDAPPGMTAAEVVRVVDGDTIIVRIGSREERLRYIGINAPESVAPNQPVECWGPESARANQEIVGDETVYLERDVSDRDRFGRLLRYVYVEGQDGELELVNRLLVERGYAFASPFPPDVRYDDELQAAERTARELGMGLWTACEGHGALFPLLDNLQIFPLHYRTIVRAQT